MRSFGSISYLFSRKALSGLARPALKGWLYEFVPRFKARYSHRESLGFGITGSQQASSGD
jgi:hypothetical protein